MRFHLAIPAQDLADSTKFYQKLGASVGRKYDTNVILNFCGVQLVLHKSNKIDDTPMMYPRHFGFVLDYDGWCKAFTHYYDSIFIQRMVRYKGKPGEHETFFLCDPSNNLIEFKYYKNSEECFK